MNVIINGEDVSTIAAIIFIVVVLIPWVYGVTEIISKITSYVFSIFNKQT